MGLEMLVYEGGYPFGGRAKSSDDGSAWIARFVDLGEDVEGWGARGVRNE